MKLFAIAFGIACGVGTALFGVTFAVLMFLDRPEAPAAAAALAGLPVAAFPKIAEFLERQEGRRNLAARDRHPLYNFKAFQIPWPLMVVYGAVACAMALQVAAYIGGYVASNLPGTGAEKFQALTLLIFWPVSISAAYLSGRWVGSRGSGRGVIATLLLIILTVAIGLLADFIMPEEAYESVTNVKRNFVSLLRQAGIQAAVLAVPALLGYWRGRKLRLAKYLYYLLGVLPAETRDTVVELAFDEAQKISDARRRQDSGSSAKLAQAIPYAP
jgi:hypothetical protein